MRKISFVIIATLFSLQSFAYVTGSHINTGAARYVKTFISDLNDDNNFKRCEVIVENRESGLYVKVTDIKKKKEMELLFDKTDLTVEMSDDGGFHLDGRYMYGEYSGAVKGVANFTVSFGDDNKVYFDLYNAESNAINGTNYDRLVCQDIVRK